MIEGLACHRAVILDTMRFFEHRDTVEQRAELVGRFVRAGFQPPELFFDCGNNGYYMLFRPRPAARLAATLRAAGNRMRHVASLGLRRIKKRGRTAK